MRLQTTLALVSLQLGIASCGLKNGLEANSVSAQSSGTALKMSKVDVNANPLDKTVCDPFGGIPADNLQQGIKASLYYVTPGMPLLNKSEDYVTFAKKSDQKLFFADLNVPTRMFHEGFATQTHDVLKDDAGSMLIENFGVKFETILKLSANDEEGDYELALLSDDGSKLKILSGTLESPLKTTVIDNDGEHPTRMGCASQIISMNRDKTVPLELTYYQGPRYHISNVLLWRKASVAGKDEACGQTGNEHFFDPNKGSVPQQAYNDLLARGWKVVQKDNFFIPKNEAYNPCVEGTNPLITKFKVAEIITQGVQLSWSTDIAATSQVKLINKETQEVILTNSDNVLRTNHFVQVTGLKSQTTYTAQAVSISEDLGKSLSEVIEFTTP